ncbi:cytochrome B [Aliidiomarina taiwanensis]|uniref:Cytochrome B n=1 Tax=Aliidiomarina taiwanensis TaxID=946228 RepID=A0A432X1V0_9GAMM|nr:cytochrome b/b6 domain-containing protein [Aliidiomarina taiwanensis]RUO40515.1 cytochrome B [Aliidiomarina taiwanensis]
MVKIWDGFIRGFHWLLVACFAGLWYTGGKLEHIDVHEMLGIFLLALLLTRIIWGFVGSHSARFRHFLVSPAATFRYMREPSSFRQHTHNPMGALSVLIMLLLLLIQVVTGLFTDDTIFYRGPLAHLVSSDMRSTLTSLHLLNFEFLKIIVGLHLLAIIAYRFFGQPLTKAMVTGMKQAEESEQPKLVNGAWGYVLLAFIYALLTWWLG